MHINDIRILEDITKRKRFQLCNYAIKGAFYRNINKEWIQDTIFNGKIIELHIKDNDARILKRSNKSYNGYAVCVVYSLSTGNIITAYKNLSQDNHYTLDESLYTNQYNVIQLLNMVGLMN